MTKKSKHHLLRSGLRDGLRGACAIALVFLMSVPVLAGQNDMCIPNLNGGITGIPKIDGIIERHTEAGQPTDDLGWDGSTRVVLLDVPDLDMGLPGAKFQAGHTVSALNLGFIVSNPPPDVNTTIVVGFSTTQGGASTDWRFHLKPFGPGGGSPDQNVAAYSNSKLANVTWWRDSSQWNTGMNANVASDGDWQRDNVRLSKVGASWQVEMKVPITNDVGMAAGSGAVFLPASGVFKFYVNILGASSVFNTTTQDPWPAGVVVVPNNTTALTKNTPDVSMWGNASLNDRPECDGVSISSSQIGVVDPSNSSVLTNVIRRYDPPGAATFPEPTVADCAAHPADFKWPAEKGPSNSFAARPVNNMSTTAKVFATFRLRNYGIPGTTEWTKIGEANPALPALSPKDVNNHPTAQVDIAPGATGNLIATWELSYRWSCLYKFKMAQCMQVDLDSNDPNTRFKIKSAQKNLYVYPASRIEQEARISGDQGELPPGRSVNEFVLMVETDEQGRLYPPRRDDPKPDPVPGITATAAAQNRPAERIMRSKELVDEATKQLGTRLTNIASWIVRGTLRTGKTININGTEYEYVRRVGNFGLVAGHTGKISGWRFNFTGQGLKQVSEGIYTLDVARGGEALVNTVIETVDAGGGGGGGDIPADADAKRWGFSLHAGASFPHSNFGSSYDPGPNFGLDLEYRLNNHVSLEALYGFHRFRGEDFGIFSVDDLNLHQFSGNVKVFGGSGATRPFLNAGGGAYHFDFGGGAGSTTRGGVNVGGGVQFNLTPTFAVEGSYNFHNVFTPFSDLKFSTLQGGVRFRF